MGYEIKVHFHGSNTGLFPLLAERLTRKERYVVLELLTDEMKLRFPTTPRRPTWPEDVMLKMTETYLLVLFHSGSDMQRTSLVDDLREILGELGERIEVEEI